MYVRLCHTIGLSLMLKSGNILPEPKHSLGFNIAASLERMDHLVDRGLVPFIDMLVQAFSLRVAQTTQNLSVFLARHGRFTSLWHGSRFSAENPRFLPC